MVVEIEAISLCRDRTYYFSAFVWSAMARVRERRICPVPQRHILLRAMTAIVVLPSFAGFSAALCSARCGEQESL
jgi:hypothetical protein